MKRFAQTMVLLSLVLVISCGKVKDLTAGHSSEPTGGQLYLTHLEAFGKKFKIPLTKEDTSAKD